MTIGDDGVSVSPARKSLLGTIADGIHGIYWTSGRTFGLEKGDVITASVGIALGGTIGDGIKVSACVALGGTIGDGIKVSSGIALEGTIGDGIKVSAGVALGGMNRD